MATVVGNYRKQQQMRNSKIFLRLLRSWNLKDSQKNGSEYLVGYSKRLLILGYQNKSSIQNIHEALSSINIQDIEKNGNGLTDLKWLIAEEKELG